MVALDLDMAINSFYNQAALSQQEQSVTFGLYLL